MKDMNIREIESRLIKLNQNNIKKSNKVSNKNFHEILENIDKNNVEIKFSKHATKRLSNRNMDISLEDMVRLEKAFRTAENKGVKDALILMDNKAFIANISSKTVITTINKDQLEEKVFTNIDGAVII